MCDVIQCLHVLININNVATIVHAFDVLATFYEQYRVCCRLAVLIAALRLTFSRLFVPAALYMLCVNCTIDRFHVYLLRYRPFIPKQSYRLPFRLWATVRFTVELTIIDLLTISLNLHVLLFRV